MNNRLKPYSILFVEDETEIRENYTNYLKMFYENIYEAENGEDGYEIYKKYKPDILILDINLPKISGLDMLKMIRENDHNVKAIMLTAYSNIDYLLKATELKLTKYLVKPISRDELERALSLAIDEILNFDVKAKKIVTIKNSCIWDYALKELRCSDTEVSLTKKELGILSLMFDSLDKTVTYDEIMYGVWDDFEDEISTIKVAIKTAVKNLRKKLPENTILNVYGIGYKIEKT